MKKKLYEHKKRKGFRFVHIDGEEYQWGLGGFQCPPMLEYDEYNGSWPGGFIVYDPTGKKHYLNINEFIDELEWYNGSFTPSHAKLIIEDQIINQEEYLDNKAQKEKKNRLIEKLKKL